MIPCTQWTSESGSPACGTYFLLMPLCLAEADQQQNKKSSREDWARTMALADEGLLYVGTNLGRLQRVWLPDLAAGQAEEWERLWDNGRAEPLVCLAVSLICMPCCKNLLAMTQILTGLCVPDLCLHLSQSGEHTTAHFRENGLCLRSQD
jgi:hypothetical protein